MSIIYDIKNEIIYSSDCNYINGWILKSSECIKTLNFQDKKSIFPITKLEVKYKGIILINFKLKEISNRVFIYGGNLNTLSISKQSLLNRLELICSNKEIHDLYHEDLLSTVKIETLELDKIEDINMIFDYSTIGKINNIDFIEDCNVLLSYSKNSIFIWSNTSNTLITMINTEYNILSCLLISYLNDLISICIGSQKLTFYSICIKSNLIDKSEVEIKDSNGIHSIAKINQNVILFSDSETVYKYNIKTLCLVFQFKTNFVIKTLIYKNEANMIFLAGEGNSIKAYNIMNELTKSILLNVSYVNEVDFITNSDIMYCRVNTRDSSMLVLFTFNSTQYNLIN